MCNQATYKSVQGNECCILGSSKNITKGNFLHVKSPLSKRIKKEMVEQGLEEEERNGEQRFLRSKYHATACNLEGTLP